MSSAPPDDSAWRGSSSRNPTERDASDAHQRRKPQLDKSSPPAAEGSTASHPESDQHARALGDVGTVRDWPTEEDPGTRRDVPGEGTPGSDGAPADPDEVTGRDVPVGPELAADLMAAGPLCTILVRDVVSAVVALGEEPVTAGLASGPGLADSVVVLARTITVLHAQLARRLQAATTADVLPHTPRVTLTSAGGLPGTTAAALMAGAGFAERHPELGQLWTTGGTNLDTVAAMARGLRPLSREQQHGVVATLLPHLPNLTVRQVRRFVAQAVDLLTPHDTDATEQRRYDRRFLAFSTYAGMVTIRGELPDLDGAALQAALHALAESQRSDGDGLTRGQRYADALITLVNQAAAHRDLPATGNGLPIAATVTISLTEAERLTCPGPSPTPGHGDTVHGDASDGGPAHGGSARGRSHDGSGRRTTVTSGLAGGLAGGTAYLPDIDTTLGDAAARFALCSADMNGVITSTPQPGHDPSHPRGPTALATALAATRLEPLAVGRTTRLATAAQRRALAIRDQGCIIPGCERPPTECQTHHVTDWAAGGRTDLDSLALLCWTHHRQVDLHRWKIVRNSDSTGPYWTVTATPRHAWRQRPAA